MTCGHPMKCLTALFLALLLCMEAGAAFATASCTQAVFSAAATPTLTPTNAGDLLVLVSFTSGGGGTPYITAVTDTQSNTWNASVKGTFGASSSYWTYNSGNFFVTALYAYASAATSDAFTITYNGGSPGTRNVWVMDCPGVKSSGALVANMYRDIAAPGTGANAVTTAGGTGSDTVGTAPALIVGWFYTGTTTTITAGTSPLAFTERYGGFNENTEMEYARVATTGTYDATATLSTNAEVAGWMIAFSEAGAPAGPTPSQFFLRNVVPGPALALEHLTWLIDHRPAQPSPAGGMGAGQALRSTPTEALIHPARTTLHICDVRADVDPRILRPAIGQYHRLDILQAHDIIR